MRYIPNSAGRSLRKWAEGQYNLGKLEHLDKLEDGRWEVRLTENYLFSSGSCCAVFNSQSQVISKYRETLMHIQEYRERQRNEATSRK